ncbi:MAG: outer membrane protein assembly factor BamB family protein [Candidatus Hodarchaeales archaeon]|jgi:outer membrane protein assembly factor BamB
MKRLLLILFTVCMFLGLSNIVLAFPPDVFLISPENNTNMIYTPGEFTFNFIDDNSTASCTLYINNTSSGTDTNVSNYTNTIIYSNQTLTDNSFYNWYVNCIDLDSEVGQSNTWLFKYVPVGIEYDSTAQYYHVWNKDDEYYINSTNAYEISNQLTDGWAELHMCVARDKNGWGERCDYELSSPWVWFTDTDNSTYSILWGYNDITEPGVKMNWTINYSLETANVNEIKINHTIERTANPAWDNTSIKYWTQKIKIDGDWENDTLAITNTENKTERYDLGDTSLDEAWDQTTLNERKYTLDDLPGGKFGWTRWSENFSLNGNEYPLNYTLTAKHPGTGVDNNSRVNLTMITGPLSKDDIISLSLWWRDPPTRIFDETEGPCTTSYSIPNDKCQANANENDTINVTFHYVHTGNRPDTYDQTLDLVYGQSKHPQRNDGGIDIPYTQTCGSNLIILKNVYNTTCSGFDSCEIEGDGDIRLLGTSYKTDYEARITYEIEFCPQTLGNSFNIWNKQELDTDGAVKSDSFVLFDINPEELWNFTTNNYVESSPAIADIDGDTVLEVVIGSDDGNVYVLNGTNGVQEWNFTTGGEVYASPTLADLDGDGIFLEVVFGSCDGNVYALNGSNGNELWSYTTGDCIGKSPAIVDVNGDNVKEIVIGSWDGNVYMLNGADGSLIWNYTTGDGIWSSPAVSDIDGDTIPDIVLIGSHDSNMYGLNVSLEDLTQTERKLWNFSINNTSATHSGIESSPAVADINNDTFKEVVFGTMISYPTPNYVFALNLSNGNQIWSFSIGSNWVLSSPVLVDINNDTYLEVMIGSHTPTRKMYALNGSDGTEIWNYTTLGFVDSSPAINDVNNDTLPDVVFGSSDNYLYSLNGLDGTLIWNYNLGSTISGSPAIEDVDSNGHYDILAGTISNKKITALDPPGGPQIKIPKSCRGKGKWKVCNKNRPATWDMYGGNIRRTRVLDTDQPFYYFYGVGKKYKPPIPRVKKDGAVINSLWRDSFSNLGGALIVENSTGEWIEHPVNVIGTVNWVNYTVPSENLQKKQTVGYIIYVSDSLGNLNSVEGVFKIV